MFAFVVYFSMLGIRAYQFLSVGRECTWIKWMKDICGFFWANCFINDQFSREKQANRKTNKGMEMTEDRDLKQKKKALWGMWDLENTSKWGDDGAGQMARALWGTLIIQKFYPREWWVHDGSLAPDILARQDPENFASISWKRSINEI